MAFAIHLKSPTRKFHEKGINQRIPRGRYKVGGFSFEVGQSSEMRNHQGRCEPGGLLPVHLKGPPKNALHDLLGCIGFVVRVNNHRLPNRHRLGSSCCRMRWVSSPARFLRTSITPMPGWRRPRLSTFANSPSSRYASGSTAIPYSSPGALGASMGTALLLNHKASGSLLLLGFFAVRLSLLVEVHPRPHLLLALLPMRNSMAFACHSSAFWKSPLSA